MQIALLGPLEVTVDNRTVTIGAAMERATLAVLALRVGRIVGTQQLVDALWGEDPPRTAEKTLQTYVSSLRRKLPAGTIETVQGGYKLPLAANEVDVARFELLFSQSEAAAGDPMVESRYLADALGLWRGTALTDLRDQPLGHAEATRLYEMYLSAEEALAEAQLSLGQHERMMADLEAAVRREPLRERRWAQLMTGLYRSGRQADALRAYQRLRSTLADELGIPPSPTLVALERAVLAQAPELDAWTAGGLPGERPPFSPSSRPPSSARLPAALSSFIGRVEELALIATLVTKYRSVTLTGPGGVGKSRLALEVGAKMAERFAGGVRMVDFAPLTEADLVPEAAVDGLGVRPGPDRSMLDSLADFVADRQLLIIFDNCDHLLGPIAHLVEHLLSHGPEIVVLAASREALRVRGEAVLDVPTLELPDRLLGASDPESVFGSEAVQLFVDRARAARPQLRLDATLAADIAKIVSRLDGLPLALELAAASLTALSIGDLLTHLDRRLSVLTHGLRTAPAHQQTLTATIEWSYVILDRREQFMLRQVAVFAGTFTLDIGILIGRGDIPPDEAVGVFRGLVAKSMVTVVDQGGQLRYRLLETVREFASELLTNLGESEAAHDRHLAWSLDLAERAEAGWWTSETAGWSRLLDVEIDNLRAALRWGQTAGRVGLGLRLATSLRGFWVTSGYLVEGRRWLTDALERSDNGSDSAQAAGLAAAGVLAYFQGDDTTAVRLGQRAVEMARRVQEPRGLGWALANLGTSKMLPGPMAEARRDLEEARHLGDLAGDQRLCESVLSKLAQLEDENGSKVMARSYLEQCREMCKASGNARTLANASFLLACVEQATGNFIVAEEVFLELLHNERRFDSGLLDNVLFHLGRLHVENGQFLKARPYLEESMALTMTHEKYLAYHWLALAELDIEEGGYASAAHHLEKARSEVEAGENGDLFVQGGLAALTAALARGQGDPATAFPYEVDALRLALAATSCPDLVEGLERMAGSLLEQGEAKEALLAFAAADRARRESSTPVLPYRVARYNHHLEALREALPGPAFDKVWGEGRSLTVDEAAVGVLRVAEQHLR